jgi:hypothetical protein
MPLTPEDIVVGRVYDGPVPIGGLGYWGEPFTPEELGSQPFTQYPIRIIPSQPGVDVPVGRITLPKQPPPKQPPPLTGGGGGFVVTPPIVVKPKPTPAPVVKPPTTPAPVVKPPTPPLPVVKPSAPAALPEPAYSRFIPLGRVPGYSVADAAGAARVAGLARAGLLGLAATAIYYGARAWARTFEPSPLERAGSDYRLRQLRRMRTGTVPTLPEPKLKPGRITVPKLPKIAIADFPLPEVAPETAPRIGTAVPAEPADLPPAVATPARPRQARAPARARPLVTVQPFGLPFGFPPGLPPAPPDVVRPTRRIGFPPPPPSQAPPPGSTPLRDFTKPPIGDLSGPELPPQLGKVSLPGLDYAPEEAFQPQPQPGPGGQPTTRTRTKECEKEKPKKPRVICAEGFYRESAKDAKFTPWRKFPCAKPHEYIKPFNPLFGG